MDPASDDAVDPIPAGDADADARLGEAVTRVEREFARVFARIRVGWREAAATVHPDLQPLGYQVLVAILAGESTAGGIVERLRTDKSAVSRQVGQLTEMGLVESIRDPEDRRSRRLVATELASERVGIARAAYEGRIAERLRSWTPEDLDHFADLLDAFAS